MNRSFRFVVSGLCAAGVAVMPACTHMPNGNKAFSSFEQCMVANGIGSAVVGVGVGVVTTKLGAGSRGGIAAGLLTAGGALILSWQRCAAVYAVSHHEAAPDAASATAIAPVARPSLVIDTLSVRAGRPGQDLQTTVRYRLLLQDAHAKDVPVREVRVFRLPRMALDAQGRAVYTTAAGQPMFDKQGRPLLVGAPVDPDTLAWQDHPFPSDIVAQQGSRRADGMLPTVAEMSPGMPYRLRFELEAAGLRDAREVTFEFQPPGKGEFRQFDAAPPAAVRQTEAADTAAVAAPMPVLTVARATKLFDRQGRANGGGSGNVLAQLPVGARLEQVAPSQQGWMQVRTPAGTAGWARVDDLKGAP
jgi:hypothetical protein